MVRVRSKSPIGSKALFMSSCGVHPITIACGTILLLGTITFMTIHQYNDLSTTTTTIVSSLLSSSTQPLIRGTTGTVSSLSSSSSLTDSKTNLPSINYESTNDDQCRFYLAESAIPYSGLGLFTTKYIEKGEMTQSTEDICIYVADTPIDDRTHFETHSWSRDTWLGTYEGGNPRAACEGFATLFNTMPPGIQTSKLKMTHLPNNVNLSRRTDANAGAITQYDGISSVATRNIPPGSEITIDYQDFHYDEEKEYEAPTRSVEWIQKHGMCIDNIRIDTATDPKMGRGAFAKRFMKMGTRVAPAPLQIFPNRSVFIKAQQQQKKKSKNRNKKYDEPEPLLVNYCFTFDNQQKDGMLLYPYGPGVGLINHSKDYPNVKVEWSHHPMHHDTWLDLSYEQYSIMDYPGGLILDIIALRDIEEGEELFMDYGDEWQQAWENHVQTWKPLKSAIKNYVYPQEIDRNKPYRTIDEQKKDPYASNLATACWTNNWPDDDTKTNKLKWKKPTKFDWPEGITFCHLLKRYEVKPGVYEYDVSLHYDVDKPGDVRDTRYIDTNVPQTAILFVELPYTSDLHLSNAFRHPMQLPNHLIPTKWVNTSTKKLK